MDSIKTLKLLRLLPQVVKVYPYEIILIDEQPGFNILLDNGITFDTNKSFREINQFIKDLYKIKEIC